MIQPSRSPLLFLVSPVLLAVGAKGQGIHRELHPPE